MKKEMSLLSRESMNSAFRKSFDDVVSEWVDMGVPSYSGLSHAERVKLAGQVMGLVNRNALDFLVNYELQLLGNVTRELAEGIKNHITIGFIQSESIAKISKNIGGIITDPEDFRRAGKTVFKTAQHRCETIVRTETLRAYNKGRHKFYETVGVKSVLETLLSIVGGFGIPVFFCADRQAAFRFVEGFLHRYHRRREK